MSQSSQQATSLRGQQSHHANALALIGEALDKLKFGAVHLTIHEGRLVQIEVTEKTRLTA